MATMKQRMLATLHGQPVECLPWAPRLDLWYRANLHRHTLPAKYRDASLMEMTDDLGWGYHAIIPDFQALRSPLESIDRCLGIYNLEVMPCRTVLENVERRWHVEGDHTIVEYLTPKGTVRAVTLFDEPMRAAGITISHLHEHAFKSESDYAALGFIFENARVEPNYDGWRRYAQHVGERGLAAAFLSLAASPMHLIQRELMPMDLYSYEAADHPAELERLAEQIGGYWSRLLETAASCPAELFFLGANYDSSITSPPFFKKHVLPWLRSFGDRLHAQEKFLLTHTDGENSGLLDLYLESHIDVADSVCPKPMTRLSLQQVREAFKERITIMGGVPSVALLPASVPDFDTFLAGFFAELERGDHQILGISDTTPPDADFGRLQQIAQRVQDFGPIRG